MKLYYLLAIICLISCEDRRPLDEPVDFEKHKAEVEALRKRHYSNERFKEVEIKKTAAGKYQVSGRAQLFEGALSWIIEDGHNEVAKGHSMTSAGAPAWGEFKFNISIDKERQNSSLTLILFEASAKDGSRQHELNIPLK